MLPVKGTAQSLDAKIEFGIQQGDGQARDIGSGICLATLQRIIHRHGGHIWTEAKSGEGSSFG